MFGRIINFLEESLLILLLATMTIITFVQVVLRYGFNTGWLWHLEGTSFLFLWFVLIGVSYGVRISSHIGVDIVIQSFSKPLQRLCGLIAVSVGLVYAFLMLFGAYNVYALFGEHYQQWGIGAGYLDKLIQFDQLIGGFYAEEIPVREWILYLAMPIGFSLLVLRIVHIGISILKGHRIRFTERDETSVNISKLS